MPFKSESRMEHAAVYRKERGVYAALSRPRDLHGYGLEI